jgi:ABC-type lipoprotein export system ATPase subunit
LILRVEQAGKVVDDGTRILEKVSLAIPQGEFSAILGPSGSGKTSLLYLLAGMDLCSEGRIFFNHMDWAQMSEVEASRVRNQYIGFIFQFHFLIPELDIINNLMLPLRIQGISKSKAQQEALTLLDELGLVDKAKALPKTLSGGQQQRVAIARALIHKPKLLLADEPTGNLDSANSEVVMNLFKRYHQQENSTIILITHNQDLANQTQKQYYMRDGCLVTSA